MRTVALIALLVACKSDTAIAAPEAKQVLEKLRAEIDERYSYRDRLKLDWKKLFAEAAADLEKVTTREQVVERLVRLLANARDPHMSLVVDGTWIATDPAKPLLNISGDQINKKVSRLRQFGKCVSAGMVDGFAYVLINGLEKGRCDNLPADWTAIYPSLSKTDGLILDLRGNGGGNEVFAQHIAGHFVDKPVVYAKQESRDASSKTGFTPVSSRALQPVAGIARFTRPTVVLAGQFVMSSAEAFVLMMRAAGVPIIGAPTRGASANPRMVDLGSGISVNIPSWRAMLPDGSYYEGIGIKPDLAVPVTADEVAAGDKVLDAAVAELKKRAAK